jgi:5-methylthioadenosine/S-adenosylhomocysteine deaminase
MTTTFCSIHVYQAEAASGMSGPCDVVVKGDRIVSIQPSNGIDGATGGRRIDGRGRLLLPGLINGHFHSSVNHMKGRLDSLPLELFMLYESPALDVLKPTPREAYLRTLLGAMEMLKCGVTAVQDDAFFVPFPEPEIIDAVMQAYADCGLRATVALDQPELAELDKLPFLDRLLPAAMRDELACSPEFGRQRLLECYEHLIGRWHGAEQGRLAAAVSCSAPQRVSPEYFGALDNLSRKHGLPVYAHMLETKLQRVLAGEQQRFAGRSLVKYTADLGLLSNRMNVIHAIWVDDEDLDLIADAGAVIAHNPISNLRLGSGIMPFRRIRERGIPMCLGTDEAIADDAVNVWSVAKMAGLIHNITDPDPDNWPKASEVLECLFQGGARAMGRANDLGRVEVGRLADLVMIDLDALAYIPLNDLRRQLVYCEDGRSVQLTMVAGQDVCRDGQLLTINEADLRTEAREVFGRKLSALSVASSEADRWLPYYRAMAGLAAGRQVGMERTVRNDPNTH